MRATYFFLMDYEERPAGGWPAWARHEFELRYVDRSCEETNYHQLLALVLADGKVFGMCPEDDSRSRQRVQERLFQMGRSSRWGWVVYWATAQLADHLGTHQGYAERPFSIDTTYHTGLEQQQELLERVNRRVPRHLARAYGEIGPPPRSVDDKDYWGKEFARRQRSRAYETFRSSYLNGFPPFADPQTPYYGYWSFDIRKSRGPDTSKAAILLAEIQT